MLQKGHSGDGCVLASTLCKYDLRKDDLSVLSYVNCVEISRPQQWGPDLPSIWFPLASSTNINKLQVIQNAALRTATGCTQDTSKQHLHDETLILPIHEHLQLHASQYKQKTQHPSHPLLKHTTYFLTLQGLKHYLKQWTLHNNIPKDLRTVTTTDIKTNMRHIHTSIVSRNLGNNKILHTPPPHISSSEAILPHLTLRILAHSEQIDHPFSNLTQS